MFPSGDLTTQIGTLPLVRQIVRAVDKPVVAAGGIADAEGVAAAAAGAIAAQVGTAYLLCDEATTSALHRKVLQNSDAEHTALTNLFTGRPARGIVNRIMREQGLISAVAPAFPLATSAVAPLRTKAEAAGSGDFSPLWSGQTRAAAVPCPQPSSLSARCTGERALKHGEGQIAGTAVNRRHALSALAALGLACRGPAPQAFAKLRLSPGRRDKGRPPSNSKRSAARRYRLPRCAVGRCCLISGPAGASPAAPKCRLLNCWKPATRRPA